MRRISTCSPVDVPVASPSWPVLPAGVCPPAYRLPDEDQPCSPGDTCNLRLSVSNIVRSTDGRWEVTLAASGARGNLEVSTNRRQYDPGLIVRAIVGSPGKTLVVYVREIDYKTCERAITVTLNLICEPPAAPVVRITETTCTVLVGSISLASQPAGVTAYWYTGRDGTGSRSLTPPVYSSLYPVSGSVVYVRTGNEPCRSDVVNFTTAPQPCLCTAVSIDTPNLPTPRKGVAYSQSISLRGTPPFTLDGPSLPTWMRAVIDGSTIVLSGTPTLTSPGDAVGLTVKNCDGTKSAPLQLTLRVLDECAGKASDWVVSAVRCQQKTTTTCTDKTIMLALVETRCDKAANTPTQPVDTCAGVSTKLVATQIRCSPDTVI